MVPALLAQYIRHVIQVITHEVLNLDKLTYAGNVESLAPVSDSERYQFSHTDICYRDVLDAVFAEYQPDSICIWAMRAL